MTAASLRIISYAQVKWVDLTGRSQHDQHRQHPARVDVARANRFRPNKLRGTAGRPTRIGISAMAGFLTLIAGALIGCQTNHPVSKTATTGSSNSDVSIPQVSPTIRSPDIPAGMSLDQITTFTKQMAALTQQDMKWGVAKYSIECAIERSADVASITDEKLQRKKVLSMEHEMASVVGTMKEAGTLPHYVTNLGDISGSAFGEDERDAADPFRDDYQNGDACKILDKYQDNAGN